MVEEVHQPDPGHTDMGSMLVVPDPGMVIWTWIVFFLFLIILRKFAWRPILQTLEEREESIQKSISDAEEARSSLEAASQEQRKLIDEGRAKASETISGAKNNATAIAEETRKKAKAESEKMITDAREEIIQQQEAAIVELRSKVSNLSVLVTSKLLNADLDNDRNRELATAYMSRFSD